MAPKRRPDSQKRASRRKRGAKPQSRRTTARSPRRPSSAEVARVTPRRSARLAALAQRLQSEPAREEHPTVSPPPEIQPPSQQPAAKKHTRVSAEAHTAEGAPGQRSPPPTSPLSSTSSAEIAPSRLTAQQQGPSVAPRRRLKRPVPPVTEIEEGLLPSFNRATSARRLNEFAPQRSVLTRIDTGRAAICASLSTDLLEMARDVRGEVSYDEMNHMLGMFESLVNATYGSWRTTPVTALCNAIIEVTKHCSPDACICALSRVFSNLSDEHWMPPSSHVSETVVETLNQAIREVCSKSTDDAPRVIARDLFHSLRGHIYYSFHTIKSMVNALGRMPPEAMNERAMEDMVTAVAIVVRYLPENNSPQALVDLVKTLAQVSRRTVTVTIECAVIELVNGNKALELARYDVSDWASSLRSRRESPPSSQ